MMKERKKKKGSDSLAWVVLEIAWPSRLGAKFFFSFSNFFSLSRYQHDALGFDWLDKELNRVLVCETHIP